jgi:DNA polymerase-3 subunit gamma/tau
MLGLADRARIYDLLDAVFAGDAKAAIETLGGLDSDGADAVQIVTDLAEAVHAATRIKVAGEGSVPALSETERQRAGAIAARLSMAALTRAWQMLLKGLEEVGRAPRPITAAEMLMIRMCYAANLPPLDEVMRGLAGSAGAPARQGSTGNESRRSPGVADSFDAGEPPRARRFAGEAESAAPLSAPRAEHAPAPVPAAPERPRLDSFAAVVALVAAQRDVQLKYALEEEVELVRFKPGQIELHLLNSASGKTVAELGRKLQHWTGERWIISLTEERGERRLGDIRREREAKMLEEVRRHPSVQSVMRHFPNAEITAVRELGAGERKKD